jgi:hypothetical protein
MVGVGDAVPLRQLTFESTIDVVSEKPSVRQEPPEFQHLLHLEVSPKRHDGGITMMIRSTFYRDNFSCFGP